MIFVKQWVEYYDNIFIVDDKLINFCNKLAQDFSETPKFLSIECGTGNLSVTLAKKYEVTATDTEPDFIRIVKDRTLNLIRPFPVFNLNPKDIAKYLGKNFYNIIYSLNYRILFTNKEENIIKLLKDCNKLLTKNGYFAFEILLPPVFEPGQTILELPQIPNERSILFTTFEKTATPNVCKITQTLKNKSGKKKAEIIDEKICFFTTERMIKIAKEAGFSSIQFFSDYDFSPDKPENYKKICLLKK